MKKQTLLLLLIPLIMSSCNQPAAPSYVPEDDNYKLVWSEEFEGTSLNTETWGYMLGNGNEYNNPGWGNDELEYYKQENVSVKNGELHITAKREQTKVRYDGDERDTTYKYTSGRITSSGKVSFKYGKIEAKIKLPAERGLWPAFWMFPEESAYGNWPHSGEIDIMEANGGSSQASSAALHYSLSNGQHTWQVGGKSYGGRGNPGSITDYHVYGVIWEEDQFDFYVDESIILTVPRRVWSTAAVSKSTNENAPYDKEFHFLLNMAVGGNYVHNDEPSVNFTEADMVVDYIRVYQYDEGE